MKNHSRNWNTASGLILLALFALFFSMPLMAQQTGEIAGKVTDINGEGLEGVSIEASGDVLPAARTITSGSNGNYRFRLLPPGHYTVKFTFPDDDVLVRTAEVLLQQEITINVSAGTETAMEEVITTSAPMMAASGQGAIKNAINSETFDALPVGQQYRDLVKLIPGVQYSEAQIRGPSAGGSGADNTYQFDGVEVGLPLFGNLATEPSTHDIAQVSIVRGGAKAVGFNRSGGFLMNTISKSGTDTFHGEVSYQIQPADWTGSLDNGDSPEEYDEDRSWITASLGGPIVPDKLHFYVSYYRPERTRDNAANAYGAVGDFEDVRDEYFGKLTWSPMENILLEASYRSSERDTYNAGVGPYDHPDVAEVGVADQDILILEGSWLIDDDSSFSFRYTDWATETGGDPLNRLDLVTQIGDPLDINNLGQMGRIRVPTPEDGEDDYNAFIQPYINQYGYLENGLPTGGGRNGVGNEVNNQDYYRESFELNYDRSFYWGDTTHDVHIGYQRMEVSEDLLRVSNGWGNISIIGGLTTANDGVTPAYFLTNVRQQGLLQSDGSAVSPGIHSESVQDNIEINDSIRWGDWTFNVGILFSNDKLYGQGLKRNTSNPSGFEADPGNRYKQYETDWSDMIQPRLGVNWDFSDNASAYLTYAKYNPSASSLARAASWDRRFADRLLDVYFDANGNYIDEEPSAGSGGKLFEANMDPRYIDEWLIGATMDVSQGLTLRGHIRYREAGSFWEDVPNDMYVNMLPPDSFPDDYIIPDLGTKMEDLGGGSDWSYVIHELHGAYTDYWEVSLEADWNWNDLYLTGSYVWSDYTGNFDNDNISTDSDYNSFIGSSGFGDGAGRNVWNYKDGTLRGNREHMFKFYGYYILPWHANVGAYLVWQSGEPWEAWDNDPWADEIYHYRVTQHGWGNSTSTWNRFAEPAGSRTTSSHWQLDLNYTQNFSIWREHVIQLRLDIFNVFDNQTGYNYGFRVDQAAFGEPRSFYQPRRFQLAAKYLF